MVTPPSPPPSTRLWCVDDQCWVHETDWQHAAHQVIAMQARASRASAPIGQGQSTAKREVRYLTGFEGWDRCLGGGLVRGTMVLLTGDPGVGKSSLTLVVLHRLAEKGLRVFYVTGEETREAVESRFAEMGLKPHRNLILYATKSWELAASEIARLRPHVILLDSLQRIALSSLRFAEGSDDMVAAVIAAADRVVKRSPWKPTLLLIGHVNSRLDPTGRKGVQHDVDTHLHFSFNDMNQRLLRTRKNRHGASGELALFEFRGKRMTEVTDLSASLLAESLGRVGVVAYPAVHFVRPIVLPIEVSVSAPKGPSEPRVRRIAGLPDAMLDDAVDYLADFGKLKLSDRSIRVKAPRVGDESLDEDAATLAVCLALLASAEQLPLPPVAAFGALTPTGRLQSDPHLEARLDALRRTKIGLVFGPPPPEGLVVPTGLTYRSASTFGELLSLVRLWESAPPPEFFANLSPPPDVRSGHGPPLNPSDDSSDPF